MVEPVALGQAARRSTETAEIIFVAEPASTSGHEGSGWEAAQGIRRGGAESLCGRGVYAPIGMSVSVVSLLVAG